MAYDRYPVERSNQPQHVPEHDEVYYGAAGEPHPLLSRQA